MKNSLFCVIFIASLFLSSCATKQQLPKAPENSPNIIQSQQSQNIGELIRWGGDILSVRNITDGTSFEILERPLEKSGAPKINQHSQGRFIAISNSFIDPKDVTNKDYMSVYGKIIDFKVKKIDNYNYTYPVVEMLQYKVWRKSYFQRNYYSPYPYYYDPFYYPYGFQPYRYYRRPYSRYY